MPKPSKRASHEMTPLVGIGVLLTVVMVGVVGLVLAWRQFPKPDPILPPAPMVEPATGEITRASCEAANGQWTDCGSPCHGKPGVVCAQVCEPQCLCGGTQGWSCPKAFTCTDWEPGQQDPAAIGVCRTEVTDPEPTPATTTVSVARPRPAGTMCDETNSICVDEKYQNTLLASPFTITGTAIAFEAQFAWRLEDGNGGRIGEGSAYGASSPEEPIPPFTIRSFITTVPKTTTGTLVLFEFSAKDGEPIHELRIPVRLPQTSMKAKFFMTDTTAGQTDCSAVSPLEEDVVRSVLPVETALQTLLTVGPTLSSKRSAIPVGTKLVSLVVKGGTATAVFSPELQNYGGGSCNVQAIRAQIEQTLKQFSSVKNVVISVEGKTPEETLQP